MQRGQVVKPIRPVDCLDEVTVEIGIAKVGFHPPTWVAIFPGSIVLVTYAAVRFRLPLHFGVHTSIIAAGERPSEDVQVIIHTTNLSSD
jgi:hypothetical protein